MTAKRHVAILHSHHVGPVYKRSNVTQSRREVRTPTWARQTPPRGASRGVVGRRDAPTSGGFLDRAALQGRSCYNGSTEAETQFLPAVLMAL